MDNDDAGPRMHDSEHPVCAGLVEWHNSNVQSQLNRPAAPPGNEAAVVPAADAHTAVETHIEGTTFVTCARSFAVTTLVFAARDLNDHR